MHRGATEDLAALKLALDQILAGADGPSRVEQVQWKLQLDGWRQTAEFASFCLQMARLKLHPAHSPPCWLSAEEAASILAAGPQLSPTGSGMDISDCPGARLFKRMQAFGISKYHPDPITALQEAEAARKAA
jgi:hypothetical protein